MYSNQKIPAPFGQPCHSGKSAKQLPDIPAPPMLSAEEKAAIPILAKEKTVPKAAAALSPLLAFLLFGLLFNKKG